MSLKEAEDLAIALDGGEESFMCEGSQVDFGRV